MFTFDFIDESLFFYFVIRSELNKPATHLVFLNLQRLLDKAITETNAQFDPAHIISRLDVRLLTVMIANRLLAFDF